MAVFAAGISACGGDDDSPEADRDASRDGRADIREFGSEAGESQARQAAAALRGYLAARAAGEWKKACSYIAKPLRRVLARFAAGSEEIGGESCAALVEASTGRLSASGRAQLLKADIKSVRVEGGRGYLIYANSAGGEYGIPIEGEGARWKLTAVSGTALSA